MITFKAKGEFKETEKFLKNLKRWTQTTQLDKYCQEGVNALRAATPVATGKTAASWGYKINRSPDKIEIQFTNSNLTNEGCPVPILLACGHATKNGSYWISGNDFITPTIKPIFDKIVDEAFKEVTK